MTLLRTIVCACCVFMAIDASAQAQPEADGVIESRAIFQGATFSTSRLAEIWDLDEEEIERYQELRITDQHYSDSKITPYEVLGKYARNKAEAERYAAIVINKELEQYVRSMDWATTVDNVRRARTLDAGLEMLQSSRTIREYLAFKGLDVNDWMKDLQGTSLDTVLGLNASESQSGAEQAVPRVRFFVDADSCAQRCDSVWEELRAMQSINSVSGIDVVFIGDRTTRPSKVEVSGWAQARGIGVDEVDRKEITLNFESERFALIRGNRDAPVAIDTLGRIIR